MVIIHCVSSNQVHVGGVMVSVFALNVVGRGFRAQIESNKKLYNWYLLLLH